MNIGIAGAGIIGRLLALRLLQQGHQVTLFERAAAGAEDSCSFAAAGLVTPLTEVEHAAALIATLGAYALQTWPEIIAGLVRPCYFNNNGALILAHQQDQAELNKFARHLHDKIAEPNIATLTPTELAELEPELATYPGRALYSAQQGHLSPPAIMTALAATLQSQGIKWLHETTVTELSPGTITTAEQRYHFDWVCDCRGLGAKADLPQLRGVRGELLWLEAPEVTLNRALIFLHPRYPIYIVPRPHNIYVIGASSIESEDLSQISVLTALELLSSAYSIHRGFAEARIIKTITQCRPALPDHLPRIYYAPGIVRINGLYRSGYALAPALADNVVKLLNNEAIQPEFTAIIVENQS